MKYQLGTDLHCKADAQQNQARPKSIGNPSVSCLKKSQNSVKTTRDGSFDPRQFDVLQTPTSPSHTFGPLLKSAGEGNVLKHATIATAPSPKTRDTWDKKERLASWC